MKIMETNLKEREVFVEESSDGIISSVRLLPADSFSLELVLSGVVIHDFRISTDDVEAELL
jgi:hypothetical protein